VSSAQTSRRRYSGEALLFAVLLVLHLVPIWAFRFFPTQDGPSHQALTYILKQYDRPDAGLLRQYFALNREALPNGFIFFLTARVLGFLSVPMAEKVVLTVYAALLPLSVRYTLRGIDRRAGFLAVLSFPFVYNYTLHMGFFNFCYSLPAFFFTLGYWLRHGERMTLPRTAALALLILWVYFCHPVTLALTLAALFTLAGWRLLQDPGALWPRIRRWLLPPALACLPALALMASFLGRRIGSRVLFLVPLREKIASLAALYSLASLDALSAVLAGALALLFYVLALLCLRRRGSGPSAVRTGLLLVVLIFVVVCLLAPSDLAGGGFINHRLSLFPFLALILWLGTFEHPAARRRWVQIAAAGLAVGFLAIYARSYAAINRELAEIVAAGDHVEPDHTLLYLSYASHGETPDGKPLVFRVAPFLHAGGYLGAEKRLVDLCLYEANESYFPVYYRPALNPYHYLASGPMGLEREPPRVRIQGYAQRTGGSVDYVLILAPRDKRRAERKVLKELAAAYVEVWASPDERVQLYRLR
jgi:hypothetical protein